MAVPAAINQLQAAAAQAVAADISGAKRPHDETFLSASANEKRTRLSDNTDLRAIATQLGASNSDSLSSNRPVAAWKRREKKRKKRGMAILLKVCMVWVEAIDDDTNNVFVVVVDVALTFSRLHDPVNDIWMDGWMEPGVINSFWPGFLFFFIFFQQNPLCS